MEFKVEFSIDTRSKDESFQLFADGVSINLKTWTAGITPGPIDLVADACARLEALREKRNVIESIMKEEEQYIQDWKYCQTLLHDIRWLIGRTEHFFEYFANGAESLEVEPCLKELFKIPIAKFDDLGFYKSYEGKPETRKVYARVFEYYKKCEESISFYYKELSLRMK